MENTAPDGTPSLLSPDDCFLPMITPTSEAPNLKNASATGKKHGDSKKPKEPIIFYHPESKTLRKQPYGNSFGTKKDIPN